jgi:MFS superfamily sulfate permease-like transporter
LAKQVGVKMLCRGRGLCATCHVYVTKNAQHLTPPTERENLTLTLLTGAVMFVLGLLRLGSVIRFVSREVMSGFVFATALLIALGQYKDLVGYTSQLQTN